MVHVSSATVVVDSRDQEGIGEAHKIISALIFPNNNGTVLIG